MHWSRIVASKPQLRFTDYYGLYLYFCFPPGCLVVVVVHPQSGLFINSVFESGKRKYLKALDRPHIIILSIKCFQVLFTPFSIVEFFFFQA